MIIEILKAILFGIIEGITEWLPVSSTGHIILLDEFVKLNVSEAFMEMFEVVIQLGAILAVIVLFFQKLNPFSLKKVEQMFRLGELPALISFKSKGGPTITVDNTVYKPKY